MNKILQYKIFQSKYYYSFIMIYVLFSFGIAFLSSKNLGFGAYTNISSSMEPLIKKGSVIIVQKYQEYNIGDIIGYWAKINNKEEIVVHRIISIGGNVYVTKGDANQYLDREIVVPRLVIGKVILIIPLLGNIIAATKTRIGIYLCFIIPAVIIITIEILKMWKLLGPKKIQIKSS